MPVVFNIKIGICLIFAATTLACHFTSGYRVCMCPVQGMHMCMRVGGSSFKLCKQSMNENQMKFDYRLLTA